MESAVLTKVPQLQESSKNYVLAACAYPYVGAPHVDLKPSAAVKSSTGSVKKAFETTLRESDQELSEVRIAVSPTTCP